MNCPPILFLIFNRPQLTRQVFAHIRDAGPARLFIAADGPRPDHPDDDNLCNEARKIIDQVDWPCEMLTLFREKNLGCRRAVSTAIDWFFSHVSEGIILEDDCIPDPSFFRYAEELLSRYRDDKRVMVVAAQHFHGNDHTPMHSYFFSRYNHIWGWASWRRAWQYYDRDMSQWPTLKDTDWLLAVGDGNRAFKRYWTEIFNAVHAGKIDTWDYQWTFSCWAQNGLSILPARNLVTNVGFGKDASHTKGDGRAHANLLMELLEFPLSHPLTMVRDIAADEWTDRHVYGIRDEPEWKKTLRKISGLNMVILLLRAIRR